MPDPSIPSAGVRNAHVTFQQNTPSTDTAGQSVPAWKDRFKRWVSIVPRGGSERWLFEQIRAEIDHAIVCNWDSQLSSIVPATWRIVKGTRTFNIDSVFDPDGTRKTLRIFATEVVA